MNEFNLCSDCGGREHYSSEVGSIDLPIGFLHGPKFRIVICGNCGLTRWFTPDQFLWLVKEKFKKLD